MILSWFYEMLSDILITHARIHTDRALYPLWSTRVIVYLFISDSAMVQNENGCWHSGAFFFYSDLDMCILRLYFPVDHIFIREKYILFYVSHFVWLISSFHHFILSRTLWILNIIHTRPNYRQCSPN